MVWHSPEGPAGRKEAEMRKHPAEEKAVKLLRAGLSDQEVAERVGTNPNHVWGIRVYYGLRPVTEKQQAIATAIVQRKRRKIEKPFLANEAVADAVKANAAQKTVQPGAKVDRMVAKTGTKAAGARKRRSQKHA
ncbi:MAG: hypothetical protein ACRDHS_02620 [Actinomycetota bacterium]